MGRKWATLDTVQFDAAEGEVCDSGVDINAEEGITYYGQTGTSKTANAITVLSLETGDPIPYSDYDVIYKDAIKDTSKNILTIGYNRYKDCGIRQWIKSDQPAGQWWSSTHVGDVAPSQLNSIRGYKAGCSQALLNAIKPIKITCYTNSVTDGSVIDTMYDDIWLPSGTEMYGSVNDNEGTYFPYWQRATGLSAPNNSANAGRIMYKVNNHSSTATC